MSRRKARAGIPPTVGLIVEGDTEFIAFPLLHTRKRIANCPPLKPTNLKGVGSHRTPDGIAQMVLPKVAAHFAAGRKKVVICLDREDRNECPGEFAQAIRTSLAKRLAEKGRDADDVFVVVLDRAFEAILLAGASNLHRQGLFKRDFRGTRFEGRLGKQNKKGVVELTELLGREYDKTSDGPKLFAKIDIAEARSWKSGANGSKSFDKFLRTLGV